MSGVLRCVAGEGLGNTFKLVYEGEAVRTGLDLAELARRLCGATVDGLLVLGPPRRDAVEVRIFNRDGSDGGVCLNGLRAAALHAGERRGSFRMAGRRIDWRLLEKEGWVELHLPAGELPAEIAFRELELDGRSALAVPFWNPHCVVLVEEELETVDLAALARAAAARRDVFPAGVNLEAVAAGQGARLRARVWERGVGETRACGSGAVAIALAAWASGYDQALIVEMPGGSLVVGQAEDGGILLSGPATIGAPELLPA